MTRKSQQTLGDYTYAHSIAMEHVQVVLDLGWKVPAFGIRQHQLYPGRNDANRIIELVRDTGGYCPERNQLLAAAGLVLELEPLTDVGEEGHRHAPIRRLKLAQTNFNRGLGSVFAPSDQIEPETHRTRPRRLEVVIAMSDVRIVQALRQQGLDALTDKLGTAQTKNLQQLRIRADDKALLIDDHDALSGGLE
jgi:hypothetical protein